MKSWDKFKLLWEMSKEEEGEPIFLLTPLMRLTITLIAYSAFKEIESKARKYKIMKDAYDLTHGEEK